MPRFAIVLERSTRLKWLTLQVAIAVCLSAAALAAPAGQPMHGYSETGEFLYPSDFTHFKSAAPESARSCELRLASSIAFDSLNPWIIRGRAADGVFAYLYDSLLVSSADEDAAGYGLIAKEVVVDEDGRGAMFVLNPRAQFHDGHPITSEDVVFTADAMRDTARIFWRQLLRKATVTPVSEDTVHVRFDGEPDPTDILSFGGLPILPAHYWGDRDFGEVTLEVPLGSGPYRIAEMQPGQSIRFEFVEDYWAREHPTRLGTNNFSAVSYTYISEEATRYLSFFRGDIDQIRVGDPRRWASYMDHPRILDGTIKTFTTDAWWPMGMNGFFFNMRDPRFQDRRVREALASLMPFEWVNTTQLYSAQSRTSSYFGNSDHEASDAPTAEEIGWMRGFPGQFPQAALNAAWRPADPSDDIRGGLSRALDMLAEAGWIYDETTARLVSEETGEPFDIVVIANTTTQDKIFAAWQGLLKRVGISATLQRLDASTYASRYTEADFEMAYRFYIPDPDPGSEQTSLWGSPALQSDGKEPILGISDPAVDAALLKLEEATTPAERQLALRLLDRSLQWGAYAVPSYQSTQWTWAYWADRITPPARVPKFGGGAGYWTCTASSITDALID